MCLDSAPLSVGSGKTGNTNGEDGSSPHCSDDPALLEPSVSPPQSNMVLRKRIRKIKQGMKRYNSQLTLMRRDLKCCKAKIAEQQKQIVEYATRLDDNDKKNEETSRKFSTLLQVFTQVHSRGSEQQLTEFIIYKVLLHTRLRTRSLRIMDLTHVTLLF